MVSVRLCTDQGELVRECQMPPFLRQPDAIVWGTRVFVHSGLAAALGILEYREGFTWFAPQNLEPVP